MLRLLTACFAVTIAAVVAVAGDDAKKDMKALQGDWKGVKTVDNNGNVSATGNPIIVEDDKMSVSIRDRIVYIGKFKLDPKASPKAIDFEYTEGPGGVIGKKKLGIYKLDGAKLEICWNANGDTKRPKKFSTKGAGAGFELDLYEKQKD
jgi:uncharacterized protein (TIGR03067 family)